MTPENVTSVLLCSVSNLSFLETIRVEDGIAFNLEYHQQRLNHTLTSFGITTDIALSTLIIPPPEGLFRCRIVYDGHDIDISYHPYSARVFRSLQAVICDDIEYSFKYADRGPIDRLFTQRADSEDIAIVKNGLITDTSIANLAFYDGSKWFTPKTPLLHGTTRQRLLDEGKLVTRDIHLESIADYQKIAVMNAMVGFLEVENGIIFPKR